MENENKKTYYLSFDVSTTNVGVALWNSDATLEELKHLQLKVDRKIPSEERYVHKANLLKNYLKEYKDYIETKLKGEIIDIFIEAPLSNTPKNINTTAMLLGFNGIASYKLYEIFDVIPKPISVHDSRKIFCPEFIRVDVKKRTGEKKEVLSFPKGWKNNEKKEYIRSKVAKLEPQIEWFYTRNDTIRKTSYDMSDAYAVGFSSLVVLGIIDLDEWRDYCDNINEEIELHK